MELIAAVIGLFIGLFASVTNAMSPLVSYVAAPFEEPRVTMLFGGDMLFDRSIRTTMEEKGDDFVFSCIAGVLRNVDVTVANLEGPITTNPSRAVGSKPGDSNNFTFTFPTSVADLLYRHNIRIVNLGNNHILNFGDDGAAQTTEWLDRAEVAHFGDPLAQNEAERSLRIDMDGIPFTFVSWSDWTGGTRAEVLEHIRAESGAGRMVIVYTHWGAEYVPAGEREKDLAHAFVDAGAEIVIGSHPHVVQEHELYNGKHIYYSLGNFIFDQYFQEGVRNGLMVQVTFDKTGVIETKDIAIELHRDRRTCVKE